VNWLAHLHLGGTDALERLGHLAVDFMRGSDLDSLPRPVQRGVLAHRRVDLFTDAHPVVRISCARIPARLSRYAGVLVDVFYDHVLAADWSAHAPDRPPLRRFVDGVHADLDAHRDALPLRLRLIAPRMIREDWLGSYGTLDGVRAILARIEGRLRRPAPLATAVEVLAAERERFAADFGAFYPELERFAARLGDR
jgi:acyl carrier protein phosphodiesterase